MGFLLGLGAYLAISVLAAVGFTSVYARWRRAYAALTSASAVLCIAALLRNFIGDSAGATALQRHADSSASWRSYVPDVFMASYLLSLVVEHVGIVVWIEKPLFVLYISYFVHILARGKFACLVMDGSEEMSTQESKSLGDETDCCICLSSLHPAEDGRGASCTVPAAPSSRPSTAPAESRRKQSAKQRTLLTRLNKCGHLFHSKCIKNTYNSTPIGTVAVLCPMCRTENSRVEMRACSLQDYLTEFKKNGNWGGHPSYC